MGPPAAAKPKAPQIKRVRLKAGRRPTISDATPQKDAPRQSPTNKAQVVKRTRVEEMPNSEATGVNVRATP